MGVPRPTEVKPPIPGAQRSRGCELKPKAINTLPLSRSPSILCRKNPAKVLIPIDPAGEEAPQRLPTKHPTKSENPKKPFPPAHHQEIYFLANKRRTENCLSSSTEARSTQREIDGGRPSLHYRFLASATSSAAPAAIPATANPVRFIDLRIAASCGRTQASSG